MGRGETLSCFKAFFVANCIKMAFMPVLRLKKHGIGVNLRLRSLLISGIRNYTVHNSHAVGPIMKNTVSSGRAQLF